jgi:hypothetical protein
MEKIKYKFLYVVQKLKAKDFGITALNKVECNICSWTGRKFMDFHTGFGNFYRNAMCPKCYSHPRHRSYYIYLEKLLSGAKRKVKILHFAPEPAFRDFFPAKRMWNT